MKKENFTAARVDAFQCKPDKGQTIHWDAKTPGLGLRVTAAGAKAFIFESAVNGQTVRMTIGNPKSWTIGAAQAKATEYRVMTDSGIDPRKVLEDRVESVRVVLEAEAAAAEGARTRAVREAITLGEVWPLYVGKQSADNSWSKHHIRAHRVAVQLGGQPKWRSKALTTPGPLAALVNVRLVDLSKTRIEDWARSESPKRPTSTRNALRLLTAFLNWCEEEADYAFLIQNRPASGKRLKRIVGKAAPKEDVLAKEQLTCWFEAVRNLDNKIASAYLQVALLTGARREEIAQLRWKDVSFRWRKMVIKDKINETRIIPVTPYVKSLLLSLLPKRNEYIFSCATSKSGHISEPRFAHNTALKAAGLPHLTIHDLRRSFNTLAEWTPIKDGVVKQIIGHSPGDSNAVHYTHRPIDMLREAHDELEEWFLKEAGVDFSPGPPDFDFDLKLDLDSDSDVDFDSDVEKAAEIL